jgi:hypothetical protein
VDFASFAFGSLSTTLFVAALSMLLKTWVGKRIESSIQHEYDKRLSSFEHNREVRLRAELVADLMAEWINAADTPNYYRLNQLSFQAFLWLPSSLARELSNTLAHKPKADDVREIILKVRRHLLDQTDDLEAEYVIRFEKR